MARYGLGCFGEIYGSWCSASVILVRVMPPHRAARLELKPGATAETTRLKYTTNLDALHTQGKARQALAEVLNADSEQQMEAYLGLKWYARVEEGEARVDSRNGYSERD